MNSTQVEQLCEKYFNAKCIRIPGIENHSLKFRGTRTSERKLLSVEALDVGLGIMM
jgi:hypothetical protein